MSTHHRHTCQRPPKHPGKDTFTADSLSESLDHDSFGLARAENSLDECAGAISLVEVIVHSLDAQEIASPEQEVLKRALQALCSVHDWIYDREWPDTPPECEADRECQP